MIRNHVAAVVLLTAILTASGARGSAMFTVSLDTSSISGASGQVVFELIDGDNVVNNSVSLSNFSLGGGTVDAPADYLGSSGVSGDLAGTIAMNDGGGFALFTQLVTFGSSLVFQLSTTDFFSGIGAPDALSMSLYTPDFAGCYSDDQVACTLMQLSLIGSTPTPASFTLNGASVQGLPAPIVTLASVPEPSSLLLLVTALLSLASVARQRRP